MVRLPAALALTAALTVLTFARSTWGDGLERSVTILSPPPGSATLATSGSIWVRLRGQPDDDFVAALTDSDGADVPTTVIAHGTSLLEVRPVAALVPAAAYRFAIALAGYDSSDTSASAEFSTAAIDASAPPAPVLHGIEVCRQDDAGDLAVFELAWDVEAAGARFLVHHVDRQRTHVTEPPERTTVHLTTTRTRPCFAVSAVSEAGLESEPSRPECHALDPAAGCAAGAGGVPVPGAVLVLAMAWRMGRPFRGRKRGSRA